MLRTLSLDQEKFPSGDLMDVPDYVAPPAYSRLGTFVDETCAAELLTTGSRLPESPTRSGLRIDTSGDICASSDCSDIGSPCLSPICDEWGVEE